MKENTRSLARPALTGYQVEKLVITLVLAFGALAVAAPFLWMLSTSVKEPQAVFQLPPQWIPSVLHWENFVRVWESSNFPRYFLNSAIVAFSITAGQLVTSALAAFAFARMNFRGKNLLFYLVLGTMMIPSEMMLIPNFVIISSLKWTNSYLGLTIPFMAGAFGIFILRQHFMTIPQELEDAATMDGCGRLRFLAQIILPISRPALITVAVFTFINHWNAYIWPLIVTRDDSMRTIQVGLAAFKDAQMGGGSPNWTLLMAGSAITMIPVLLIYSVAQKWFTPDYTTSGIRG
jgi:multiple sugar transport system permease protein